MTKKRYVGYYERLIRKVFVIIVLMAVIIASALMLQQKREPIRIAIAEQGNIGLSVFLKDNDFYDTDYLPRGMQYIASLIDHLDVTFNYNFNADHYMDYTYSYDVQADIVVFERNNPTNVIFQRTNEVATSDGNNNVENQQTLNIEKNVQIDYSEYNDLVRDFKSSYNITADSHVVFTFNTRVLATNDNMEETIEKENSMDLTVPLSEQMVNISLGYDEIEHQETFGGTPNRGIATYLILAALVLATLLWIIAVVKVIQFLSFSKSKKSAYQKALKKILTEYDRVIVNAKGVIDIPEDVNLIEVDEFGELLDVSDKIGQPILFMEIHQNQKSWFIVKNDNDYYRFILKGADLE